MPLLNAGIATGVEHETSGLTLIEQAKAANNKSAVIASGADAYRADKAFAAYKQSLEFQRETKRSADLDQTGLGHLDVCERLLARESNLFLRESDAQKVTNIIDIRIIAKSNNAHKRSTNDARTFPHFIGEQT